MLNETQLRDLLRRPETQWIERKSSYQPRDVKQAIVGFANSVPDGQHAVLFIGISPDGKAVPVENVDKAQRDIRRLVEDECFPPIRCSPTTVTDSGIEIIAVVVESSPDRPHFAGHAYIRRGSETIKASREQYEELVATRNSKARKILAERGKTVSVQWFGEAYRLYGGTGVTFVPVHNTNCEIVACDAHCVELDGLNDGKRFQIPLEKVMVGSVSGRSGFRLIVTE